MLWPFDAKHAQRTEKANADLGDLRDAVEQMKNDHVAALREIENRLLVIEDAVVAIRRAKPGSCCEGRKDDG